MKEQLEQLTNKVFGDGLNDLELALRVAKERAEAALKLKEKLKEESVMAKKENPKAATPPAEEQEEVAEVVSDVVVEAEVSDGAPSYEGDITPAEYRQLHYYLEQQRAINEKIREVDARIKEAEKLKESLMDNHLAMSFGLDAFVKFIFDTYKKGNKVKLDEKTGRFIDAS